MPNNIVQRDRVAIIGIGLTLPGGVVDPDSFWKLLAEKRDATIDIPKDRWDVRRFYSPYGSDKPGKMYVNRGGFLQGKVGEFDPLFFGISPREASVIDVQQRLLLEVAVKTFQDAGITDDQYLRSKTGVFVGGFCMDAHVEAASIYNRNWCLSQSVTGSTATLLSNRLSYVFNLKGPSLTIDTACSSSLVATHYAVESILAGECDTALVGGVNIMTQPEHFMEMCKAKLLSKDGRCFTWDKRANGYARGEGAGMLLLKPLSTAIKDKDHIYAVVEASGVNQDGTTKGISLPNPEAQAELIERVLKKARLAPSDIDYVEAHGTGTQAGDKAETLALNNVFAKDRPDKLYIGSVKTNIGHLEAAAGVSGLIKAALCLKNGKIPANLHFDTPNPEIPFDSMCLKVSTEMQSWPRIGKTKLVGVNAFGYGGTNAHVILSEAPIINAAKTNSNGELMDNPLILPLSAKSKESLKALATQYKEFLEDASVTTRQFLRRVSTKRNHYERRALIHASSKDELLARLHSFSTGTHSDGVACVETPDGADNLVFVYSGMGPQWWGMGKELLVKEPLFFRKIKEYDQIFQKISGWSLLQEMESSEIDSRITKTEVAQPMNFAIQAALTELWRSWGIMPAAVIGHSVGEVTSAYVSGILSLEDALLVSYHRSRLQGTLAGTGGMLAVGLSQEAVHPFLKAYADRVSIAAVNSPHAVTLAGHEESLQELATIFQRKELFNRVLQVEVPYHSPLMAPIETELQHCLRSIIPQPAKIPCYSTVSGQIAKAGDFDATYWWHNVRETVQFAKTIVTLCDDGYRSYLEIGPHPVLNSSIKEVISEQGGIGLVYSSLNRKTPEQSTLLNSLGLLYAQGYQLNWDVMQKAEDCYFSLPIYPWQKASYDNASPKFRQDKFGEAGHPILYRNLQLPYPAWEVELSDSLFPYIKDHRIAGKVIVPGAFYVETALALNEKITGQRIGGLRNLSFERILALADETDEEEKRIISTYSHEASSFAFKIFSTTTAREERWEFHAHGEFAALPHFDKSMDKLDHILDDFQETDIVSFYKTLGDIGLSYGPYFQLIKILKSKDRVVYAEIENTLENLIGAEYILPPTVLDSVFQTLFVFGGTYRVPYIPVKIDHLNVHGHVTSRCKVLGRLLWISAKSLKADFMLFNENDDPIVEIKGVTCQALAQIGTSVGQSDVGMYRTVWSKFDTDRVPVRQKFGGDIVIFYNNVGETTWWTNKLSQDDRLVGIDMGEWSKTSFEKLLQNQNIDTFVYMPNQALSLDDVLDHAVSHCAQLTELVQLINQSNAGRTVELLLCSQHASKVLDSDSVDGLSLSTLFGLGRVVNTEYPHIKCSCIDFASADDQEMELFYDEILNKEIGVNELAIRGKEIYMHALIRQDIEVKDTETIESSIGQRVVIDDLSIIGSVPIPFKTLDRISLKSSVASCNLNALQENEIEVEVDYMTLSYWDDINSRLTIYPDDPARHYFQYKAGMQCVGVVVKKGNAVKNLALGDRVLSLYAHGISNFSVFPSDYAVMIPDQLRDVALPDIYEILRARFAIQALGALSKDAVLVVKGRWGAFVQTLLAEGRSAGMFTVFVDEGFSAAAKSEAMTNHSLKYLAAEDGKWTNQLAKFVKGVDVFVNQGGQNIDDLYFLNPFGKVIDFTSSQILHKHLCRLPASNCIYHLIDIDKIFRDHFGVIKEYLDRIVLDLATGKLSLPITSTFTLRDIEVAINELKGGLLSAVRIQMKHEIVSLLQDIRPIETTMNGTVIVTGGTRGFGLQCARWLVQKGVNHIVLLSRRGLIDAEAINAVKEMQDNNVIVKVCALDIADCNRLREEMATIMQCMPPVRGVIHGAMVLDDGFLSQMQETNFRSVMTPKIQGAINLYQVLEDVPLDFFLMFSSISSLIGNSGQANYVAANSFLDGFSHYLTSRGIPAKTINWGALSDTGVLAKDQALIKVLEMAGIHGVNNEQAMASMEAVLREGGSQTGIFRMDWGQWASVNPSLSQSGFYRELLDRRKDNERSQKLMEFLMRILDVGSEERKAYIQRELAIRFGEIFKMSPDAINVHASIIDLGVDSLISAEISAALKSQLGVEISMIELLSGPSIVVIGAKILTQIEAVIAEVSGDELVSSTGTSRNEEVMAIG